MDRSPFFYVTYNGDPETTEDRPPTNNIIAFDENGVIANGGVLDENSFPEDHAELRNVLFKDGKLRHMSRGPDGDLYVVAGANALSKVLCFDGTPTESNGKHKFKKVFIDESVFVNDKLKKTAHPYQLAWGPDGVVYVSNQNTYDVKIFCGPNSITPGKLLPDRTITGFEDVRGIALHETTNTLYVAAKHGGVYIVKHGETQAKKHHNLKHEHHDPDGLLQNAISLLIRGDILYIANSERKKKGNNVLLVDLSNGTDAKVEVFIRNDKEPKFDAPSGINFGPDGKFYVNSRIGRQTVRYDVHDDGKRAKNAELLILKHPDFPQFISFDPPKTQLKWDT